MKGAIVMLTKNYIIENKVGLFNGALGEVIDFGYPTKGGPMEQDLPDYMLIDFKNPIYLLHITLHIQLLFLYLLQTFFVIISFVQ